MSADTPRAPALSVAALHVLLALADGPLHGYAIMQTVTTESTGTVRLGPTTLYRTLRTLHDSGLVHEAPHDDDVSGDARRRYYRITEAGRQAARAELSRLEALLGRAHAKRHLYPDPSR
jgi:DNA-binding PadR family transcriptional regulator